jgi:D-arabinose 1-dehydrogenase-like Zn-dependent alcohol dehydrogenase
MRAVQISNPGADFQIVVREMPDPSEGQVRIKVQACGVCHSDELTVERSWPGIQYPHIPGHESGRDHRPGGSWRFRVEEGAARRAVTPFQLIRGSRTIQGWAAGTPADSDDTPRFAELTGVRPMIETYPLEKAAEAYQRMVSGKATFRVVLTM